MCALAEPKTRNIYHHYRQHFSEFDLHRQLCIVKSNWNSLVVCPRHCRGGNKYYNDNLCGHGQNFTPKIDKFLRTIGHFQKVARAQAPLFKCMKD